MTRNPIINALGAVAYIAAIALFMTYAEKYLEFIDLSGIFVPIAFLSLFVFSAAAMGYIFLSQPIQMFLEGEKKGAVTLFLQTLAAFALSTVLLVFAGLLINSSLFR